MLQLLPSVALVSIINELLFNSQVWPFGAPLVPFRIINAAFQATPLRFLSLFYSAICFGFILPFIPRLCQAYLFFAVQAVVYALAAAWFGGFAPRGIRPWIVDFFTSDPPQLLIPSPSPTSPNTHASLLRSALSHSTLSLARIGELQPPPPADDSVAATCFSIFASGSIILFALWALKRKNVLLLSPSNILRYVDTCFLCAFSMTLLFMRAVAAVTSVGAYLQPATSALAFHVGSLYLGAHLSIVEIAAIVELILYPTFMALRVMLLPVAPVPAAAVAAAAAAADAAAADARLRDVNDAGADATNK